MFPICEKFNVDILFNNGGMKEGRSAWSTHFQRSVVQIHLYFRYASDDYSISPSLLHRVTLMISR